MEQLFVYAGVFAASLFAILLLKSSSRLREKNQPPSPASIPVLGHLHLLGNILHQSLLDLSRTHGDLMLLRLGSVNALVASSASAAREVLKVNDLTFASRPLVTAAKYLSYSTSDLVWAPYGDHWRIVRKLCTLELFTAKQIDLFRPYRKLEVTATMSEISRSDMFNLGEGLRSLTFNIMSRMLFSKSYSEHDEAASEFKAAFVKALSLASKVYVGEVVPCLRWLDYFAVRRMRKIFSALDRFLEKEIEQHRTDRLTDDFIGVMLSLQADCNLSNDTIKGIALDVIIAGSDTSAGTVEWAVSELIKNPHMMKRLQRELDEVVGAGSEFDESRIPRSAFLQAIVKETLRLHPPTPLLLPHESTQPCKVREFDVPAQTRLMVNAYAIGRDPNVWERPLEFDPERFMRGDSSFDVKGHDFELIPFGAGRRICPGIHLGLTTVLFIVGSLVHRFELVLPEGVEEVDMSEGVGITAPRASSLVVIPKPRW